MRKFSTTTRGSRARRAAGFTLVELMIALAVLLVLLSVGVPHSASLLANNRLTSQANEMAAVLSQARSEAINRTTEVRVVPDNPADWSQGWSLVADVNKDGDFTDNEDLVRIGNALEGGTTLTADASSSLTNEYVAFNARGALDPLGDTFAYQLKGSHCTGSQVRLITVAATGRIAISRLNCP